MHLAVRGKGAASAEVITLPTPDLHFPSIGKHQPGAILMERAIFDLQGLTAGGLPDPRPWLDHGVWPQSRATQSYAFKPVIGEGIHQIPVGPVHAGTIEPGHFRFSVNGETIVRLEARLGYTHKGTLELMRGAPVDHAAKLAWQHLLVIRRLPMVSPSLAPSSRHLAWKSRRVRARCEV